MFDSRTLEELLQNPSFMESPEYDYLARTAEDAGYSSVRELALSLISAFKDDDIESARLWFDEIDAAVAADTKGNTFPPLHRVASYMRRNGFDGLTEEHIFILADFLDGSHRRKKGRPLDEYPSEMLDRYECLLQSGKKPTKAMEQIADSEKIDLRTAQRNISSAKNRRENAELINRLSKIDISRFLKVTDGNKSP